MSRVTFVSVLALAACSIRIGNPHAHSDQPRCDSLESCESEYARAEANFNACARKKSGDCGDEGEAMGYAQQRLAHYRGTSAEARRREEELRQQALYESRKQQEADDLRNAREEERRRAEAANRARLDQSRAVIETNPYGDEPEAPAPATRPATKAAPARVESGLMCRDGTMSPTCSCNGSHRGCCSHHGGVAGCAP